MDGEQRSENPDELWRLQETSRDLLERIRGIHRQLADRPDPGGEVEQELAACMDQRDRLATQLGHAVLRIVSGGGRVTVAAAEPPASLALGGDTSEVEVDPAIPETSKGPPADASSLVAFVRQGMGPSWTGDPEPRPRSELQALARALGEPRLVDTDTEAREQVHRIVEAVARMEDWRGFPRDDQRAMLGLVSSLARLLQDESPVDLGAAESDALARTFSQMTSWSKTHQPGYVPGLSRSNPPNRGSWLEDAVAWRGAILGYVPSRPPRMTVDEAIERVTVALDDGIADDELLSKLVQDAIDVGASQSEPRLIELLAPHAERLHPAPGLKTLKGHLRDANRDEDEDEDESAGVLPEDWPLWSVTSGKRAVILGGDRRPLAAERIRDAFRFADVVWEEADVRRGLTVADRVRGGTVDVVIALRRFLPHLHQDVIRPVCKEVGVPFCLVDTGYGVSQVRLAIERYCADQA